MCGGGWTAWASSAKIRAAFRISSPATGNSGALMQQRQLRLGDILDDYCPRERRVTNHAVVAMIGEDVKQTRCTTCDSEHEYKHAKVPRQRRKAETPAALYAQVLSNGPKRVAHEPEQVPSDEIAAAAPPADVDVPPSEQRAEDAVVEASPAPDESPHEP